MSTPQHIVFPEQLRINIRTPLGPIRQLGRAASVIHAPLPNCTIDRVSGQLYTRPSGERVLLLQQKATPPARIDEVLIISPGQCGEWLKPQPWTAIAQIPGGAAGLAPAVLQSLTGQFFDIHEQNGNEHSTPGLRPPQIGALYAALAHWTTTSEPATIVMPTGTGKTETMLALFARERLPKLLVIVPTDPLRDQVARKFQTLGVLREFGLIGTAAHFPVVGILKKIPISVAELESFVQPCNVIVTTMAIAGRADNTIQEALARLTSHLFIDEAHHIKAPTWERCREHFCHKPILQFTATPFRNDGKLVDGKPIYTYPLCKAQEEDYFRPITFRPILEFSTAAADEKIAQRAIEQLRSDLQAGFDHLLMARTQEVTHAEQLLPIYEQLAADLHPLLLHSKLPRTAQQNALAGIKNRESRIIICVDMLGEGFDLPQLKIAAIHDAHKSLAVTLQFIGRFTRTLQGVGNATAIANIASPKVEGSLRALYAEDSDWNQLLQVLADNSTQREARRAEFLAQFSTDQPVIPLQNIMPKMSTVIYRTDCKDWNLVALQRLAERMGLYGSLSINQREKVALFVVKNVEQVDWGSVRELANTLWQLYLVHWDENRGVLYIHTSDKDARLDALAEAIAGTSARLIHGEQVFRVFHGLKRIMLMNLGLNHSLSRAVRFTMFVGADIVEALSQAQQQGRIKSNTFGRGFENGEKTTIGCSHRGRIWSYQIAPDISLWVDWCHTIAEKVLDDTISFDKSVLPYLLILKEVTSRPNHIPLMVEWWEELLHRSEEYVSITMGDEQIPFFEVGIEVIDPSETGPLLFRIFTEKHSSAYEVIFTGDKVAYRPLQTDVQINFGTRRSIALSRYFQDEPPVFYFDNGGILMYNRYGEPNNAGRQAFDPDRIEAWDWTGTNITIESQTPQKLSNSIQYRVLQHLQSPTWNVQYDCLIDDDAANEAADIVGLKVDGENLIVHLFHCKYSSEPTTGARVKDLYEVCGQAQRSARWRHDTERLLKNLLLRDNKRVRASGVTRFEKGNPQLLVNIKSRCRFLRPQLAIFIVQPGLSQAQVKTNQLELLANTELYVRETSHAQLRVIASP
jgi:superfamily II DNA or RNA helicase